MRLSVSSNRMTLLNLRKRLLLARRGHKMLKDKLDELMRHFLSKIKEVKSLSEQVKIGLKEAQELFILAGSISLRGDLSRALILPGMKLEIEEKIEALMNLRISRYTLKEQGKLLSYGPAGTSSALDKAMKGFLETARLFVQLAEREKEIAMLSSEIDRTRRRVNALEYILIPNLLETIKYIVIKLEELERGNLTRLMKIKEIVRQH